jgi:hypothetical protein
MTAPSLPNQKLVPAIHPGKAKGGDGKRSGDGSTILNLQSIPLPFPQYPISNLQCPFLPSLIRREFQLPANRALHRLTSIQNLSRPFTPAKPEATTGSEAKTDFLSHMPNVCYLGLTPAH